METKISCHDQHDRDELKAIYHGRAALQNILQIRAKSQRGGYERSNEQLEYCGYYREGLRESPEVVLVLDDRKTNIAECDRHIFHYGLHQSHLVC